MGDAQLAELAAAHAIQTCAKGFLVRSRLQRIARAALAIQKVWRGFLGRKRFQYFRSCRNRVVRQVLHSNMSLQWVWQSCCWYKSTLGLQAYFHLAATTIQRWFRGFCSRKYCHSVAARRRYLQTVSLKSAGAGFPYPSYTVMHPLRCSLSPVLQDVQCSALCLRVMHCHSSHCCSVNLQQPQP